MASIQDVINSMINEMNLMQSAIDEMGRTQPSGFMSCGIVRDVTIASDTIDAIYAHYAVTPESSNADDVDTIDSGRGGRKVTFRIKTPGDTITFKDGVDNLNLSGGDIALSDVDQYLTLIFDDENEEWKVYAKGF